ncbi:MAG: GNAT family N-acetyltransferase [Hyphomonadaceae bacterium]|nr:GNAT family N-acetyltransferase [Hyphomonadaceae bacterium]
MQRRDLLTQRLRLAPVTAELSAIANESADALAGALGAEIPQDWMRSGLPLVRRRQEAPQPWRPMRCVAIHREHQVVIGDIRFERTPDPALTYEIGYAIIPAYRRQGLAVEAAGRVIDHLFQDEGARLVVAGCDRRNRASIRTLRKLGFWLDGSRGTAFWWLMDSTMRAAARRGLRA